MKKITLVLCAALLASAHLAPNNPIGSMAQAQEAAFSDLPMNGVAAFEQLRMQYYIGALLMENPSRDAATVIGAPGRKRLAMHITADRWPPMRFAQQWNQAILINSDSATLNANVMDVLAFTSMPKDDLVAGDRLYVDLDTDGTTSVSLNGVLMMRTNNDALFRLIANSWIGPRPPSSDFKSSMLSVGGGSQASALLSRFESTQPTEERRKLVASWGGKVDPAAPVATATAQPPAPGDTVVRARVEPPAVSPAPEERIVAAPVPVPRPVQSAAPPAPAAIPAPEPASSAPAGPQPAVAAAPAPKPAPAAKAEPTPAPEPKVEPVSAQQVAVATPAAIAPAVEAAKDAETQKRLYEAYSNTLRRQIYGKLKYPRRAVERSIEGLVVVKVDTDRNGRLLDATTAQGAHNLLDKAAISAAQAAAPFPIIDGEIKGSSFSFMIPVVFKLTE